MPPFDTTTLLGGALFLSLAAYFLFGGADFGGGVWDLLATGPRRDRQREVIAAAIGPIWEANHVWLILAIVLLFSAFPPAFAAISTALHVPLVLYLVGIVFRGSAFAFRGFVPPGDRARLRWGLVFSLASVFSPFFLGAMVGALASGRIRIVGGRVAAGAFADFFAPWLAPFPLCVGALAVALSAYLAAVYLTVETDDPALQEDFRRRAILAGVAVGLCAALALLTARTGAPLVFEALVGRPSSLGLHLAAGAAAVVTFIALARRRFRAARITAAVHTLLILAGWAASQYPYLIAPDLTLASAAAPARTRALLLGALAIGAPILGPSLWVMFRVFKARRARST